jgi:hypothetical protein
MHIDRAFALPLLHLKMGVVKHALFFNRNLFTSARRYVTHVAVISAEI